MFHTHQWKTIKVDYSPPPNRTLETRGAIQDLLLYLIYGLTNITQKCTNCGELKSYSQVGKVDIPTHEKNS